MTLKTDLTADLAAVFYNTDEFADDVTYTVVASSPDVSTAIKAIVTYGSGEEYRGSDQYGVRAVLRVKASDVAQPAKGDLVIIGTATWVVIGAESVADAREWEIEINRRSA